MVIEKSNIGLAESQSEGKKEKRVLTTAEKRIFKDIVYWNRLRAIKVKEVRERIPSLKFHDKTKGDLIKILDYVFDNSKMEKDKATVEAAMEARMFLDDMQNKGINVFEGNKEKTAA